MLASLSTWLQQNPAVIPTVAAALSLIALTFTARSFYLNARATKLTLFNNVRQRIEDAGKKVGEPLEAPTAATANHHAYLNELEWLCRLVLQGDIPRSIFDPYYGETFAVAVQDYRHLIDEVQRTEQANAYADILSLAAEMAKPRPRWYRRIPLPWSRPAKLAQPIPPVSQPRAIESPHAPANDARRGSDEGSGPAVSA